ncbi:MAG TPA: hypothetical protein VF463_13290 [Sphingobium sp.]
MTESKTPPETEAATKAAATEAPEKAAAAGDAASGEKANGVSSKVWMGTAVGVGSAALVAALMYAKRRK